MKNDMTRTTAQGDLVSAINKHISCHMCCTETFEFISVAFV